MMRFKLANRLVSATVLTAIFAFGAATPALAQDYDFGEEDDDDPFGENTEEEEDPDAPERIDEDDELDIDEKGEQSLDTFLEDPEDDTDLLFDDLDADTSSSTDSAELYRATQEEVSLLGPDEEVQAWEQYLVDHPATPFRNRINDRMEELMGELYSGGRIGAGGDGDAMDQEIDFSHGLQLENLNPRTRLQGGFEWGLPDYLNFFGDYEYAFARRASFHAGLRRRYTGWNFEVGPRLALVKSTRTSTIITLMPDLYFKANPAFPGARPQLAIGKIFGNLHAQVQGGTELEIRTPFAAHIIGGANLTYMASEDVALFFESSIDMKNVSSALGDNYGFRFNVISFGMKFYPREKGAPRNLEVNSGATVPYTTNYWQWHYGSVMGQFNYYM